jgi:GH35 family endo-1,4-beta-xylanase
MNSNKSIYVNDLLICTANMSDRTVENMIKTLQRKGVKNITVKDI